MIIMRFRNSFNDFDLDILFIFFYFIYFLYLVWFGGDFDFRFERDREVVFFWRFIFIFF